MKKIISFFLALNIFLCYGGLCDLCHATVAEQDVKADCHSMGAMEMEHESVQSLLDKSLDYQIASIEENTSLCQYFLLSKSFELEKDYTDFYLTNELNYSLPYYYKDLVDINSLIIPKRATLTKLYIKNSSYLI